MTTETIDNSLDPLPSWAQSFPISCLNVASTQGLTPYSLIRQFDAAVQPFVRDILSAGLSSEEALPPWISREPDAVSGMNALHYVARAGAVGVGDDNAAASVASDLLALGMDASQKCLIKGFNPLHYAAFYGAVQVARVLLHAQTSVWALLMLGLFLLAMTFCTPLF